MRPLPSTSERAALTTHPCFNPRAAGRHGRLHLPVAPDCNISCNYCNRAYDCVHESRPGVSSTILAPEEAVARLDEVLRQMPWITVAGIAGPGDAFADPERTHATLDAIRRRYPSLHLCLSTNGLAVVDSIDELVRLKVGFVTVTVNAATPQVGARIYRWIQWQGERLRGVEAAALLLDRQLTAISRLAAARITVKVNTVVIPGINADQTTDIAKTAARLGATLHNLIPIIPVPGTPFASVSPPSSEQISALRRAGENHLPQMRHCMRCRADSAGLLGGHLSKNAPRCGFTLAA